MRRIQTEVLVIGGGATGTGVLRDLAMRGFRAVLVERRDLASGTTGRFHGLLHSGARYVVTDPQAARECGEENKILRRIIPQCLEDTGGYFVLAPDDDPDYADSFLRACQAAAVAAEEVDVSALLHAEPRLNPGIRRCFRVLDGSADSFLSADLHARQARALGAEILRYHTVDRLIATGNGRRRVVGASCSDLTRQEEVRIEADCVVNASGAWANEVLASVGLRIPIRPGKGVMVAVNHRVVNSVINRCKAPADGDILVPAHTVSIIGTTDEPIGDPDHNSIEPWEISLMMAEGEKLIPGFSELRVLRAWSGVRPLFDHGNVTHTRRMTRAHSLLDHETQDNVAGLVTITGGKWTTFRLMAEVTVDKVCQKLGTTRRCETHLHQVEADRLRHFHALGHRLAEVEGNRLQDQLVCECELATYEAVREAIVREKAQTVDDIRRDTRAGMGPCQAAFCAYRLAGMLGELGNRPAGKTNEAVAEFLDARWRGLRPVLWGSQLKQEGLSQLINRNVLCLDRLPGVKAPPEPEGNVAQHSQETRASATGLGKMTRGPTAGRRATYASTSDVLVVGAGFSGLITALIASRKGRSVRVISRGRGALEWGTGTIDIWGPPETHSQPWGADLSELFQSAPPRHPYAIAGAAGLADALRFFSEESARGRLRFFGSELPLALSPARPPERNLLIPTAAGALRPTCLVPDSMKAGARLPGESFPRPVLLIGIDSYFDFFPAWCAENLATQGGSVDFRQLSLPIGQRERYPNAAVLARALDDPHNRRIFIAELVGRIPRLIAGRSWLLGFPPVLGLRQTGTILQEIRGETGCDAFEIPGLPPSVPGMRLENLLLDSLAASGVEVLTGIHVLGAEVKSDRVEAVFAEAASRQRIFRAKNFVLATGGILGGGVEMSPSGALRETIFDLPVIGPAGLQSEDSHGIGNGGDFFPSGGHPVFAAGVEVNSLFQPVDQSGVPPYRNLFAVGSLLAHTDPVFELSQHGVSLASASVAGRSL